MQMRLRGLEAEGFRETGGNGRELLALQGTPSGTTCREGPNFVIPYYSTDPE
jgi:hypothetical protein